MSSGLCASTGGILENVVGDVAETLLVNDRCLRKRIRREDRRGIEPRVRGMEAFDDRHDEAIGERGGCH